MPDALWLWCFEGKDAFSTIVWFGRIAKANGLPKLGLFTHHKGFAKVLGQRFGARIDKTEMLGEMRILIDVERFGEWQLQTVG